MTPIARPMRVEPARRAARPRAFALAAAALTLAAFASSCAYYNTFYLAKKYYARATDGRPYDVDRANTGQGENYRKAIDFSKKVMSSYPKSKWVDDAYVMWAKSLLGRDDPLQTVNMLQDFDTRFPNSPISAEARFYLGVGYRQARKYGPAVEAFDAFLAKAPRHELAAYAHLERARALVSLQRYGDAAASAGRVLSDFPRSELVARARLARAEARFQQGEYAGARDDYRVIGAEALNDDQRFTYLLREADCLEAARQYEEELALLREALSHEQPPPPPPEVPPGTTPPPAPPLLPGQDRYGRLSIRIGTAHMLAGRLDEALQQFRNVIQDYPRGPLAAEAQYRIGYAYETVGDDFARAVQEYATVKDQLAQSAFVAQATTRSTNLERIQQYRTGSGADSLEKRAEAGFLTAEQYLFQLEKPERALEAYAQVVKDYPGTPVAGRALNAQAWVLSRKLDRAREADTLFWKVVREYPGTEAQLAARDYLEQTGQRVPENLIVPPKPAPPPPPPPRDTTLTPPPATTPALAPPPGGVFAPADSLGMRAAPRSFSPYAGGSRDSLMRRMRDFPRDSLGRPIVPGSLPYVPPRGDSARTVAPTDSARGAGK